MKNAFGMKVDEYKGYKGLKRQELHDHMTELELIITMLGEATTTKITKERDSQGIQKLKRDAKMVVPLLVGPVKILNSRLAQK